VSEASLFLGKWFSPNRELIDDLAMSVLLFSFFPFFSPFLFHFFFLFLLFKRPSSLLLRVELIPSRSRARSSMSGLSKLGPSIYKIIGLDDSKYSKLSHAMGLAAAFQSI
jgi:hypothetical protein